MHATDARDRIYGLLDMSRDAMDLGIKPDYNKSTVDLFVELACTLMRNGDLTVLLFCRGRQLDGLPSWVPDWTAEIIAPWSPHDYFSASGDLRQAGPALSPLPPGWLNLNLYAVEVGRIASRGSTWGNDPSHEMSDEAAQDVKIRFQEVKWLLTCSGLYTKEDVSAALWQIPIGNKEPAVEHTTQLATDASYQGYLSMHKYLREHNWGHGTIVSRISPLFWEETEKTGEMSSGELMTRMLRSGPRTRMLWNDVKGGTPWSGEVPEPTDPHDWRTYYKAMRAMKDSCPVLTSNDYVGLAPGSCQNDDVVIIPLGSTAPIVVRPVDDGSRYVLVGEMYGHGIMQGEFMKDQSRTPQVYVLI